MLHPMHRHSATRSPVSPCCPPAHLLPQVWRAAAATTANCARLRLIRAPVQAGRPGLDSGAGQPGGDGRRQSRPPRDRADDARHFPGPRSWRRSCCSWRPGRQLTALLPQVSSVTSRCCNLGQFVHLILETVCVL